jgi:hypothetical protein
MKIPGGRKDIIEQLVEQPFHYPGRTGSRSYGD